MRRKNNLLRLLLLACLSATGGLLMQTKSNAMNEQSTSTEQKKSDAKPRFYCNMLALDKEARKRHGEVMKQLRTATKEVRELSDGYGFRFASDQATIMLVSEFVARERLCCPFFIFEMVIEPEEGPLWLRLKGEEGVKEFIKVEFGLK
jgi:hypothetical protein